MRRRMLIGGTMDGAVDAMFEPALPGGIPTPAAAGAPSRGGQLRVSREDAFAAAVVDALEGAPTSRRGRFLDPAVLVLGDLIFLAAGALLGGWAAQAAGLAPLRRSHILLALLAGFVALAVHGGYRSSRQRLLPRAGHVMRAMVVGYPTAVIVFALLVDGSGVRAAALSCLPMVLTVSLGRQLTRGLPVMHQAQTSRILIVGSGRVARRVASRLSRMSDLSVVGMVDDDPSPGDEVLGRLRDLPFLVEAHRVDHVLVAFSRTPSEPTLEALRQLNRQVCVSVVPRLFEMLTWRSTVEEVYGIPVLHVAPPSLSAPARIIKRTLDIVVAGLALTALSPVLLAASLAIKLDSPGPVLFKQLRWGRRGQPFHIYKFRTMHDGAHAARRTLVEANEMDGPLFKLRTDPRVTRVGAFLRKTSIDELPQLLNVLRGEMSLVGPRPFVPEEAAQIAGAAARRYDVLPGMTGLWQVSGRSELSYDDLRHLDTVYVTSWSLWWDLRILLQTPAAVLRRKGAY